MAIRDSLLVSDLSSMIDSSKIVRHDRARGVVFIKPEEEAVGKESASHQHNGYPGVSFLPLQCPKEKAATTARQILYPRSFSFMSSLNTLTISYNRSLPTSVIASVCCVQTRARMQLITILLFLGICLATSTTMSAWSRQGCTEPRTVQERYPKPYTCYYITGASASLRVQGLKPKDTYKVFSDARCRDLAGVVEENGTCLDFEFMSFAYTPALEDGEEREIVVPEDPLESLQQEIALGVDGRLPVGESLRDWAFKGVGQMKGGPS